MLVDTSVWLGLARDPKDLALLGIMERLIREGLLTLVVPSVVLKEFLANRERVAAEHGKRVTSHFRSVKDAVQTSGAETEDIQTALRILDEVDQNGAARTRLAAQTFNRIEKLLRAVPAIEPSDAIKLAVYERAIERRAPFHQGENEAADAVIIEIYTECVRAGIAQLDVRWMFVTRNTDHFSADQGTEKKPHPDFKCFTDGKSEYFISLPDALRNVEPGLSTDLLRTWELEQPTLGDLISRYIDEARSKKPLGTSHEYALIRLRDRAIGRKIAAKLQAKDIVEHCRSRVQDEGVVPTTVRQDLTFLRGVLSAAEDDWDVLGVSTDAVNEAWRDVEKLELVAYPTLRDRRPTADEIKKLHEFFREQDRRPRTQIKMVDVMEFALATGRPIQEIHSLRWSDFNESDRTCVLRGKTFPLLDEAVAVILRQPKQGDLIFPHDRRSASMRFVGAKKRLEIKGLRLHDLRREAVLRMFAAKIPSDRIAALTGLGLLSLERYRSQLREPGDSAIPWGSPGWKRQRSRRRSHSL